MAIRKVFLLATIVTAVTACQHLPKENTADRSLRASDWTLTGFVKVDSLNPILRPDSVPVFDCPVSGERVFWEERNVLNPTAVVKDGKVFLLYRSQDRKGTSRIGLATSEDGLHFTRLPQPVFSPDNDSLKKYEWPGGCEDPRVIEMEDGSYLLTYTSYDGTLARLCFAVSKDLLHWTKKGLMLPGGYRDKWSKSGAIVAKQTGDKIVATKINGKYWMYFGDTDLFMITSADGTDWEVLEDIESKKQIAVLHPRRGYFDSRLVEPGPYALLQEKGIWMIYNASNAGNYNDPSLPRFTYSAGQALFDATQPYKLISRTDSNFFKPEKPYEKVGEVNEVCFLEGLVYFRNKWFLYYGTADSKLAVAVTQ